MPDHFDEVPPSQHAGPPTNTTTPPPQVHIFNADTAPQIDLSTVLLDDVPPAEVFKQGVAYGYALAQLRHRYHHTELQELAAARVLLHELRSGLDALSALDSKHVRTMQALLREHETGYKPRFECWERHPLPA